MSLQIELVSPENIAFSGEAKMVVCRVADGDIAFQTGHVPFVGVLQTHEVVVILEDDSRMTIAVHSGFVEVSNNKVTVLSDICELSSEIDVNRAEKARETATEAIRNDENDMDAQKSLERSLVRLRVAETA